MCRGLKMMEMTMTTNDNGDPEGILSQLTVGLTRALPPNFEEEEEDPNEGVKDCHTCYHSLELHRNGVSCGAIPDACSVQGCCRHEFPARRGTRCTKCSQRPRALSRCGHYHAEEVTCAENEALWAALPRQEANLPVRAKRIQLVVTHNNENVTYHPVGDGRPWRIDAGLQELVIGRGVGRVMVPLCNIMYYTLEEY